MKKVFALLLILIGVFFVLYALIVLVNCFNLLSSVSFSGQDIGYSLGTLFGPLLLLAIARWIIRKGIKIVKSEIKSKTS